MSGQNWRTPVDAFDYFGQQKRQVDIEQRRPVSRRAADLVGPGIGASAVPVLDWNDLLATFNGYYSSAAIAANTPNSDEAFVGFVVMDSALGGVQTLTGVVSGNRYTRVFARNPADPETLVWGEWNQERIAVNPITTLRSTSVQNITSGGGLQAVTDAWTFEENGDHVVYAGDGEWKMLVDGTFNINGSVSWQTTGGGRRLAALYRNGVERRRAESGAGSGTTEVVHGFTLERNETISLRCWQNSGSTLSLTPGTGHCLQFIRVA